MKTGVNEVDIKIKAAKVASRKLAYIPTDIKNKALLSIANALMDNENGILTANRIDYDKGKKEGMSEAMLDRLVLTSDRLQAMSSDVKSVAALADPIGETYEMRTLPNGLQLGKRRVPLGLIGAIYESRPNVTVDISILCIKSGNSVILRGGKEAINSNLSLARVIQKASYESGIPQGAIQCIESTGRELVGRMLKMRGDIDLVIPRGGSELISYVAHNAAMPVVTGGIGVCHTYIDKSADLDKAVAIAYNAKVQRPTVCNALDTLLVHTDVAQEYLEKISFAWSKSGVEMRCDKRAFDIVSKLSSVNVIEAGEEDWGKEFLALVAAVKVVDSLDDALAHIEDHGSGHSEAIVTEDYTSAMRFLKEVDAACV